ncbi:hypothetical protein Godav_025188 [Gossypium davidsonii]|uniref:Uncharacterized protein n=2 Tax=Gossypium TaxID=3633 RepID=A0A7J8TIU4_GOSDV|nr:hypothetical protein [Gossypium davidsonii]MBA0671508.1 hypothetical protein [Gossypium klotzschianum]
MRSSYLHGFIVTFGKLIGFRIRFFLKIICHQKEIVATPRRDDISEEKWMAIL